MKRFLFFLAVPVILFSSCISKNYGILPEEPFLQMEITDGSLLYENGTRIECSLNDTIVFKITVYGINDAKIKSLSVSRLDSLTFEDTLLFFTDYGGLDNITEYDTIVVDSSFLSHHYSYHFIALPTNSQIITTYDLSIDLH